MTLLYCLPGIGRSNMPLVMAWGWAEGGLMGTMPGED